MVVHLLLAMGVVGLAFGFAGLLVGLISAMLMGGLLVLVAAGRPRGDLWVIHRATGEGDWAWRDDAESPWRSVNLECDYLGPWLVGLRLDGRRLWLWPDSSDKASLRALRRELLSLS
ncbi:hypothetical protein [Halomonas sp.]|jgi:hypothetical protein|uniref:hypothetical protein n=1 Tax=Halomonas sp. TaxID=1486246 RepID=UPI003567B2EF